MSAVVHAGDQRAMERDLKELSREQLHRLSVAIAVEQNRRTREFIAAESERAEEA